MAKSIERLLEKNDPALELMKMQVDFDSTYSRENNEAQRKLRQRSKMIAAHKVAIGDIVMEDPNDFEALTSLYRKIFR